MRPRGEWRIQYIVLTPATCKISPPLETNIWESLEKFGHSFAPPLFPFQPLVHLSSDSTDIAKCHEVKLLELLHVLLPGEMATGTAIILTKTKQGKRIFANVFRYSCLVPGTEISQSTHKYHCHWTLISKFFAPNAQLSSGCCDGKTFWDLPSSWSPPDHFEEGKQEDIHVVHLLVGKCCHSKSCRWPLDPHSPCGSFQWHHLEGISPRVAEQMWSLAEHPGQVSQVFTSVFSLLCWEPESWS